MEELKIYRNSRNFVPIDVAKGLDLSTGEKVNADDIDPNYERLPKCQYCANFKENKEKIGLGWCQADKKNPFIAYPDMCAVTCGMYKDE